MVRLTTITAELRQWRHDKARGEYIGTVSGSNSRVHRDKDRISVSQSSIKSVTDYKDYLLIKTHAFQYLLYKTQELKPQFLIAQLHTEKGVFNAFVRKAEWLKDILPSKTTEEMLWGRFGINYFIVETFPNDAFPITDLYSDLIKKARDK